MGELDIDKQVAEQLKKELDKRGAVIDTKLDEIKKIAEEVGPEAAKSLVSQVKDEISAQIADFNEKHKQYTDRLDIIETKAGRFGEVLERKNLADVFSQKLSDTGVKSGYRGLVEFKSEDFAGIRKADDMTGANTFTNNVPGYDHLDEIHFDPDRKARIRDLIMQGTTDSTAVEYIRETALSDGTVMKAEGAEFGQSDFDLTAYTANVRKITAYVMLSEEMLDDVAGMTSYILARLPSKINNYEDTQILAGAGTGVLLSGLVTNASAYTDALADSAIQKIDVIVDAIRQVADGEYVPTAVLLHPTDYYGLMLTKDSYGQYILPWILGVANPQLAGIPIVVSTAQTADTFLVMCREAAQVFFRKELSIEFGNQNEDNFIKGMVTVRAQKRLALAIYSTAALLTGTFTNALATGSA